MGECYCTIYIQISKSVVLSYRNLWENGSEYSAIAKMSKRLPPASDNVTVNHFARYLPTLVGPSVFYLVVRISQRPAKSLRPQSFRQFYIDVHVGSWIICYKNLAA